MRTGKLSVRGREARATQADKGARIDRVCAGVARICLTSLSIST